MPLVNTVPDLKKILFGNLKNGEEGENTDNLKLYTYFANFFNLMIGAYYIFMI